MEENICIHCDWQGVNFQNIWRAHTAQYKKTNKQPNQKMGTRSNIFSRLRANCTK